MHPVVLQVTERIQRRSQVSRSAYLRHIEAQRSQSPLEPICIAVTWHMALPPVPARIKMSSGS